MRPSGPLRAAVRAALGRQGSLNAVNPFTGQVAWEERRWDAAEGVAAVERAQAAERPWRGAGKNVQVAVLRNCSAELRARADEFAAVIATEMGKPVAQGKGEVLKCATVTDYYADNLVELLEPQAIRVNAFQTSHVVKRPLGVILLLMPWNFPFWQVFRQAAAALAVGNTIVCKHAPNVPRSARLIEEVVRKAAREAGAPEDIYVNLPMLVEDLHPVFAHDAVRAVSLTGSSVAGAAVGAAAGKLLKPTVLELGGSDPSLVLEDADVKYAAERCAMGRMLNAGQSCIGAKRFLVVREVYNEFVDAFCEEMAKYAPGNPVDEATKLGPLVDRRAQQSLHIQAEATKAAGARAALQGGIPTEFPPESSFYTPTVLVDVPPATPGYCEELFGPVASVIPVDSEEHAIQVANASRYGLGASVYTQDLERGSRIATEELDAGMCFVNDFVQSNAHLPFGGVKDSGYGRECSSYGVLSFCNVKSVVVA